MLKRWASCEDAGGGLINTGASVGVDLDRNKSWHEISARSPLVRLSAPGEQQAVSHPVPAREAADRLASLQMANLLVALRRHRRSAPYRYVTSKLDFKLHKTAAPAFNYPQVLDSFARGSIEES